MSKLASIIWSALGSMVVATIFIAGFIAVFFVAVGAVKHSGVTPVKGSDYMFTPMIIAAVIK